jgi:hypothetical protein
VSLNLDLTKRIADRNRSNRLMANLKPNNRCDNIKTWVSPVALKFWHRFIVRELGEFGKVDKYNWWPPIHEKDLPSLEDQAFLHPVLDERKYVASCVRHGRLRSYFLRNGQLRRLLERTWLALPRG